MLELRRLRKMYSGIPAVEDVSFTARSGEITGYLGANGSGKSTTMKMATGLIEPSSGAVALGLLLVTELRSRAPDVLVFEEAYGEEVVSLNLR